MNWIKIAKLRIVSFFALSPLVIYPLKVCPFRIPFIFCAVCPVRCWPGVFRWWIALAIVLLNLKKRFFCRSLCPFGTLQEGFNCVKVKKIRLPRWTVFVKYGFFAAVIASTLFIDRFLNAAGYGRLALYLVGLSFLSSAFIFRPWCRLFCPIDSASDIVDKFKGRQP